MTQEARVQNEPLVRRTVRAMGPAFDPNASTRDRARAAATGVAAVAATGGVIAAGTDGLAQFVTHNPHIAAYIGEGPLTTGIIVFGGGTLVTGFTAVIAAGEGRNVARRARASIAVGVRRVSVTSAVVAGGTGALGAVAAVATDGNGLIGSTGHVLIDIAANAAAAAAAAATLAGVWRRTAQPAAPTQALGE